MQLLATTGAEGGESKGLGWIEGHVRRLEPAEGRERVPHMGWNEVRPLGQPALFEGVNDASDFYFVHSYHLDTHECQAAVTDYCGGFVSAVERGHVFGVQFHPEKSQRAGLRVLKNFLAI
jgi:glutamine amidotransferase